MWAQLKTFDLQCKSFPLKRLVLIHIPNGNVGVTVSLHSPWTLSPFPSVSSLISETIHYHVSTHGKGEQSSASGQWCSSGALWLVLWDRITHCSESCWGGYSDWPTTPTDIPVSISPRLGLQAYTTPSSLCGYQLSHLCNASIIIFSCML